MSDKKTNKGVSEIIGKVISVGVGAAFMTEEYVKNVVGDLPLPKEMVTGLVTNAKTVKEDLIKNVRDELHNHLSKVDPKKLVEEVLENYDVEVNATFKFKKKKKSKKV